MQNLKQKFVGSMLGAALGDAVGAHWEGRPPADESYIRMQLGKIPLLRYTDDTHMTIGIAESLIECKGLNADHIMKRFMDNYFNEPWRGYGPGPPKVFNLMKKGVTPVEAAASIYPGGSYGNGSAMRAAPIGLVFNDKRDEIRDAAYASSRITHTHVLAMEGAALQALAVALAVHMNPSLSFNGHTFITDLIEFTQEATYRQKLEKCADMIQSPDNKYDVIEYLGNSVAAPDSVPAAIYSFLRHHHSFKPTVIYAISLGGDTDTIASMAGAISGAYLGSDAIPEEWLEKLENRDYITELAEKLFETAINT